MRWVGRARSVWIYTVQFGHPPLDTTHSRPRGLSWWASRPPTRPPLRQTKRLSWTDLVQKSKPVKENVKRSNSKIRDPDDVRVSLRGLYIPVRRESEIR